MRDETSDIGASFDMVDCDESDGGVAEEVTDATWWDMLTDAEKTNCVRYVPHAQLVDLERQLADEQERHAQLQSRCYEGFPSVSDGIFDALKEADRKLAKVTAERDALQKQVTPDCCVCGCLLLPRDPPTDGYHCLDCIPDLDR